MPGHQARLSRLDWTGYLVSRPARFQIGILCYWLRAGLHVCNLSLCSIQIASMVWLSGGFFGLAKGPTEVVLPGLVQY